MKRLSDDPAVRLAECRGALAAIPDYFVAACDKFDWTPEEALRFYAEGKHFDTVAGRTRILCTGAIASHALKGLAGEYAEMKGIVTFDEPAERAKFAQWFLKFTLADNAKGNHEAAAIASTFKEVYWHGWLNCAKSRAEVK